MLTSLTEFFTAYAGHLAGLNAAFLWVFTSFIFTAASRRVGPTLVNTLRLLTALTLLTLTNLLLSDAWYPPANAGQCTLLALSGLVGLTIGDQLLFLGMLEIGPRLATLIMTAAPIFAALFGFFVQHESLEPPAVIGMLMTVGGIAWVVGERRPSSPGTHSPQDGSLLFAAHPRLARGILFSLLAALCQAGGMLLSKRGMGHGWLPQDQFLPPLAASQIRMSFAFAFAIPLLLYSRWRISRADEFAAPLQIDADGARQRRSRWAAGISLACLGGILGPFLGATSSLVASDRAPLGVAQTLCSLTPVLMLPFSAWFENHRPSLRAAIGAVVAVTGTALLFLPARS